MSKIHLELLDKDRLTVFRQLAAFKTNGYLAGGTALALQINHRYSEDFDVFIGKSVDKKLRLKVEKYFGHILYYVNTSDQISFTTQEGVKVTFVWYYYKPLKELIKTDSIALLSVDDIMADKTHTIGRRAVWRDYVDVFYLLKNQYTDLGQIIKKATDKFKGEFVATQFLEQLRYFDDLKVVDIQFIGQRYSADEIKSFLEKSVEDYIKKILPIK